MTVEDVKMGPGSLEHDAIHLVKIKFNSTNEQNASQFSEWWDNSC